MSDCVLHLAVPSHISNFFYSYFAGGRHQGEPVDTGRRWDQRVSIRVSCTIQSV